MQKFLQVAALLAAAGGVRAQDSSEWTVERLPAGIAPGTDPRDARFASIDPLPMVVHEPVFGAPATERTSIRVAHDGTHLWVIAHLFDSEAAGIRANSLYRDRQSGDDVLGIVLDPFGDNENGLWLWTTPAGVRGDASLGADGSNRNLAWNGFWEADVTRAGDGWFAVVRIPFAMLGFVASRDTTRMGLTVYRYIARKNERHVYPSIPADFDVHRVSRTQRIIVAGVRGGPSAHATPYVLAGVERAAPAAPAAAAETTRRELGLDVQYHPAPNLTFDATLNTDFAQVEADDERVNLTRFSLFFPERRRFFQERSGVFDFVTGGSDRLFHSRRIGLRDGASVAIVGGARLVGRLGAWDIGALDMQTDGYGGGPAENFGVVRVRRRILNDHSYGGMLLTTRAGGDGSRNIGLGMDAVVRVFGDEYLTVQAAHTVDRLTDGDWLGRVGRASLVRAAVTTRRQAGVLWGFTARTIGEDYSPRTGFVERTGIADVGASVRWVRLLDAARLRRIDPFQLFARAAVRHDDGRLESGSLEYNFDAQWRGGAELGIDVELYHEDLREPLELPRGVFVPAGRYTFPVFVSSLDLPPGWLLTGELDGGIGRFHDGWRISAGASARWNATHHLELAGEYGYDRLWFPTRVQQLDVHVARLRIAAALDTRLSATAFIQYNDVTRAWSSNLRLRANLGEGHDVWLVYDENARHIAAPLALAPDRRTLLFKYTRTFTF